MDLCAKNRIAREKRAGLPTENHFAIQDLRGLPPLFDWVECCAGDTNFQMLLGGDDDGVALRFFWNGSYEKATISAWAWFARRAKVILDIGAHTGCFTLAAFAANPSAQIISFEPYFVNFTRLILNMRANGASTKYAFMVAAGDRAGAMPFSISAPRDRMATGGFIGTKEGVPSIHIQAVALDAFLPAKLTPQIGLVKMDVEGFEEQCLSGMVGILTAARPVIFFECTCPATVNAAEKYLRERDYTFLEIDDDAGTISPVTSLSVYADDPKRPSMNKLNRIALPDATVTAEMII